MYRECHCIRVDSRIADWQQVAAHFADDAGDTLHPRHPMHWLDKGKAAPNARFATAISGIML